MGKIRIGISGWTYPKWKDKFYPKGLSAKKQLEYASRQVKTIEINGTFYRLQTPNTFQRWYNETPKDFMFAVKAGQYITHVRRLKEVDSALSNFLASGILCLKEKLGPILWQFPPFVKLKDDRFEQFLKMLPHTSKEAAKLAKNHTAKIEDPWTKPGGDFRIRHAFEFRHESFMVPEFIELLKKYNVALVFAHAGKTSPYREEITSDFVYARLHGENKEHKKGYRKQDLEWWARRIKAWESGENPKDAIRVGKKKTPKKKRDVFLYFDNEVKVYVPQNAMDLASRFEKKSKKAQKKAS